MKACPFCAESIQDAAIVCRFCGRSLETGQHVAVPASSIPSKSVSRIGPWLMIGLLLLMLGFCGIAIGNAPVSTTAKPSRQGRLAHGTDRIERRGGFSNRRRWASAS